MRASLNSLQKNRIKRFSFCCKFLKFIHTVHLAQTFWGPLVGMNLKKKKFVLFCTEIRVVVCGGLSSGTQMRVMTQVLPAWLPIQLPANVSGKVMVMLQVSELETQMELLAWCGPDCYRYLESEPGARRSLSLIRWNTHTHVFVPKYTYLLTLFYMNTTKMVKYR